MAGTASSTSASIPYWFAVPGSDPVGIAILYQDYTDAAGSLSNEAVVFRITDVAGLPYTGSLIPTVTMSVGGGKIRSKYQAGDIPGTYAVDIRAGSSLMEIDIVVGGVTQAVFIGVN